MYAVNQNNTLIEENVLRFRPAGFRKQYGVRITVEDAPEIPTRLQYDVAVEVVELLPAGGYLAAVTTTGFKVNGFEPDLVMEQLAQKCRMPLEHVVYIVEESGTIAGIYNHTDIVQKWLKAKERLEMEYAGENFRKYVAAHERVLLDKDLLVEAMQRDIFIKQFFFPLYSSTFTNFTRRCEEEITFFNISYRVNLLLELDAQVSPGGNITVLKHIDREEYDASAMPITAYDTHYVLNPKMEVSGITGTFENHGRAYKFNIAEKYSGY